MFESQKFIESKIRHFLRKICSIRWLDKRPHAIQRGSLFRQISSSTTYCFFVCLSLSFSHSPSLSLSPPYTHTHTHTCIHWAKICFEHRHLIYLRSLWFWACENSSDFLCNLFPVLSLTVSKKNKIIPRMFSKSIF